jgi:glycosyltransferase involved in cell wall biosynthesis
VVIAARDEAETIGFQLEAVLAQEHPAPWEVIVADNGSTDGTQELVQRLAAGDFAPAAPGRVRTAGHPLHP